MEKNNGSQRMRAFDYARAISMIWIVGVWHLLADYMRLDIKNPVFSAITYGVLGTFTYISGYFLGKKQVKNIKDARAFLKKRLLRIYPLFFVSCTSLFLVHIVTKADTIVSMKQYLLTLAGMSCIFKPAPSTIWYVSMIILFYLFTPLIIAADNNWGKAARCTLIYAGLILLDLLIEIDGRVLLWFPVYSLGLISSNYVFQEKCNWAVAIGSVALFFAVMCLPINAGGGIVNFISSLLFVAFILQFCKLMIGIRVLDGTLKWISYASMSAYLFHRQWYGMLNVIWARFDWMKALCALITLLIIAYIIQKIYDCLIVQVEKRLTMFRTGH